MCQSANLERRLFTAGVLTAFVLGLSVAGAQAAINLEWRTDRQSYEVGETVEVDLYAVYAPGEPEYGPGISAMEVILEWDPVALELVGNVNNGPYSWLVSAFITDPYGFNDTYADGDAMYIAMSQLGQENAAQATLEGLLVTTVEFTALAGAETVLNIAEVLSEVSTKVYTSAQEATNVLGAVDSVTLTIAGGGVLGDLNCDGQVNTFDIDPFTLALTDPGGYASSHPGCDFMLADVNSDGQVNAFDIDPFVALLSGG